MAYLTYCRACLKKNDVGKVECAFCGASLLDNGDVHTTLKVAIEQTTYQPSTHCAEYIDKLVDGTFALFVMDREKPLIVQNAPRVILGRMLEGTDETYVNFPDEEAIELGLSRRHAQISYEAGQYYLMDFNSTNGTWLNRQKLTPHANYPLRGGDIITLGRLRLLMCLNPANQSYFASQKEVILHIIDRHDWLQMSFQRLTPHYLGHKLAPYLQAMADLQYVIKKSQGQIIPETQIRSIETNELEAHISVKLTSVHEAIEIIQKRIMPWREGIDAGVMVTPEQNLTLNQLADAIIKDVAPDALEADQAIYVENLLPALTILANGELVFSIPEVSSQ
jgi:hypothetical protein